MTIFNTPDGEHHEYYMKTLPDGETEGAGTIGFLREETAAGVRDDS